MKLRIFLLAFAALLVLGSCNKKTLPQNTSPIGVIFVDSPYEGAVTLRSDGFGKSLKSAQIDAVEQAFQAILFRGIPEFTGLRRPLIKSKSNFYSTDPNWFKNFIESRLYEDFILKDYGFQEYTSSKGKQVNREFTINYRNLRIHLEEKGFIRTLGY